MENFGDKIDTRARRKADKRLIWRYAWAQYDNKRRAMAKAAGLPVVPGNRETARPMIRQAVAMVERRFFNLPPAGREKMREEMLKECEKFDMEADV